MNESGSKSVTKAAARVAASATHSHEIDTKGFKYATIDVVYSPFTAATGTYASVCKVQEHDVTATGQTDVTGLAITAGAGSTTGAAVGAVARFNVDLRGRGGVCTTLTLSKKASPVGVGSPERNGRA